MQAAMHACRPAATVTENGRPIGGTHVCLYNIHDPTHKTHTAAGCHGALQMRSTNVAQFGLVLCFCSTRRRTKHARCFQPPPPITALLLHIAWPPASLDQITTSAGGPRSPCSCSNTYKHASTANACTHSTCSHSAGELMLSGPRKHNKTHRHTQHSRKCTQCRKWLG